jgi:hypothetical protein
MRPESISIIRADAEAGVEATTLAVPSLFDQHAAGTSLAPKTARLIPSCNASPRSV